MTKFSASRLKTDLIAKITLYKTDQNTGQTRIFPCKDNMEPGFCPYAGKYGSEITLA